MRPTGSPGALERRRRRAIALVKQNFPPVEVARRVGVDRRSVRWGKK
ncbi:MAG: helix-turn-helix domain-containing protein [Nitrospinota bacterium]